VQSPHCGLCGQRRRVVQFCTSKKKADICDLARQYADICDLSKFGNFWNRLRTCPKFNLSLVCKDFDFPVIFAEQFAVHLCAGRLELALRDGLAEHTQSGSMLGDATWRTNRGGLRVDVHGQAFRPAEVVSPVGTCGRRRPWPLRTVGGGAGDESLSRGQLLAVEDSLGP
jgi:hypothetical protein